MNTLIIVWRITEYCDLGCHFCAYSRRLQRPRAAASREDVLRFGALLGEYAHTYQRDVLVSWLGGEPLHWPPVFDLSRASSVISTCGLASRQTARRSLRSRCASES